MHTLLLSLIVLPLATLSSAPSVSRIIPEPRIVAPFPGQFTVIKTTVIVLGKNSTERERFAAEQLQTSIKESSDITPRIIEEGRTLPNNCILLTRDTTSRYIADAGIILTPEMSAEGYALSVTPRRIIAAAPSSHGLFYGVMSLCQMLTTVSEKTVIPAVLIHDWPLMQYRGISDDMSRGQSSTMENLKYIIRTLARYKYNVYSPYIEDIFAFTKYPSIWKDRGALTHEQVRELEEYADQYYIDVVPIFETLGHFENILLNPEFQRYADFPGAHVLNVSSEETYKFLQDLIDDIAQTFRSPYFNMAADETYDVGLGASREMVARSDIATVHAEHYRRVLEMLQKHHKKVMMYADVILDHPEIFEKITKDLILVDWNYHASFEFPSVEKIRQSGFRFIVSPAVWNFLNPFPNYAIALPNIQNLIREGYRAGAMGASVSNWGDYGGETLRELIWYGNAWGAECSWSPLTADIADFDRKFFSDFYGTDGEEMAAVYDILNSPLNQEYWNEIWRHPFVQLKDDNQTVPLPERLVGVESAMPTVERLLDAAEETVTRNHAHIRYLRFIVRLHEWFAKKVRTSMRVEKALSGTPAGMDIVEAIDSCTAVRDELKKLKEEFAGIWLENYRPDNLDLLLKRYDYQIGYWQEKIDELGSGRFRESPLIASAMIYAPGSTAGKKENSEYRRAFFRKTITIDAPVDSAFLQLIGDTWARLYVNDSLVGEVAARKSLSLRVEFQRVKIFDISRFLIAGNNVIAVDGGNFDRRGNPGVNIEALIATRKGVDTLLTDSSWKASEKFQPGWISVNFDDAAWKDAAPRDNGWTIIKPNFKTRRTSWIER